MTPEQKIAELRDRIRELAMELDRKDKLIEQLRDQLSRNRRAEPNDK